MFDGLMHSMQIDYHLTHRADENSDDNYDFLPVSYTYPPVFYLVHPYCTNSNYAICKWQHPRYSAVGRNWVLNLI